MRTALLLCGTGAAVGLRVLAGGVDAAASIPAALLFAAAALAVTGASGWRPGRTTVGAVAIGAGAGALLVLAWLLVRPQATLHGADIGTLAVWTPPVARVVVA